MQFGNQFEVSLPPAQAWALLMDVQAIVPCMPGAQIVEVKDDRNFRAKVSVKLGPVAMVFVCDLRFDEIDDAAMTAKVSAQGADAKGRGNAEATVDFRCMPSAIGTLVKIDTDLALSGAVAQYGRGVGLIQTVANQIIGQFARNLEQRIGQLKAHGASFGKADAPAAAPQTGAAVLTGAPATSNPAGPGAAASAATPGVAVAGDYPQGYREGYASGFSAGHEAGFALGRQLTLDHLRASGPDAAAALASPHGRAPLPPFQAKPISGFSLMASSLWASLRGAFSRGAGH